MEAEAIQSVLAFGTALSGLGSCAAAYFAARAVLRQERRDVPAASVWRDGGAGPFTVAAVGAGGRPFQYGDLSVFHADTRHRTQTVMPDAHARFEIHGGRCGRAYAVLACGRVFLGA